MKIGCVLCGKAICQFEHVDPPFSQAKAHDPSKITLLCGYCHDKVTRSLISKNTIKKAMENPICLRKGFTHDFFDLGIKIPQIVMCSKNSSYIKKEIIRDTCSTLRTIRNIGVHKDIIELTVLKQKRPQIIQNINSLINMVLKNNWN